MSDPTAEPTGSERAAADSLSDLLGITAYEHPSDELARAELPVSSGICQPYGIVHGGALSALAESVTSRATSEVVLPENVAFGQTNETSFLRTISAGVIHAEARARHRGRTTWVWDVEMRDDEGRLCALTRMTIAVRPMPTERRSPGA